MNEIMFGVENSDEGGFVAKALGFSIFTEGETYQELKENIIDAVKCHLSPQEFFY
jgi:predicted RNase H-like HicB family nuclease